jgi:hypothetical protein
MIEPRSGVRVARLGEGDIAHSTRPRFGEPHAVAHRVGDGDLTLCDLRGACTVAPWPSWRKAPGHQRAAARDGGSAGPVDLRVPCSVLGNAAWTPSRADLLLELCGEIGDEDTSLVERAEERADRFDSYSDVVRER